MEGWSSGESPPEDPGDRGTVGQAEEREDPETIPTGLTRGGPTETETKG